MTRQLSLRADTENKNGPIARGLEGVVIAQSTISNVEGTIGRLSYRGYSIDDLSGPVIATFVDLGLLTDDGHRIALTREGLMVSDAMWPEML